MFFPPPATHHHRGQTTTPPPSHWTLFLVALTSSYLSLQSFVDTSTKYFTATSWGGIRWKKQVMTCADLSRRAAADMFVIVTGDAGFFGSHVFFALKKWGGAVTLPIPALLAKLLEIVAFTHVMHLAAQAGVCYANPPSNIHRNVAALVKLLATCTLSSSVYRLNDKVPFSEDDHTDQPASFYAATKERKKEGGEEITHTYSHIYGLSITCFFAVYDPWGSQDVAYFSILQGSPSTSTTAKAMSICRPGTSSTLTTSSRATHSPRLRQQPERALAVEGRSAAAACTRYSTLATLS